MNKDFYLILHNIRSAYNVGAIFRTADGMGVDRIYISGYTPSPRNRSRIYATKAEKMIAKTALGAENCVEWKRIKNISKLMADLRRDKFQIVALEQSERSFNYKKFKSRSSLALIVGNEPRGINKRVLEKCDAIIEIPMRGRKESLNVAVALGIAGYYLADQLA